MGRASQELSTKEQNAAKLNLRIPVMFQESPLSLLTSKIPFLNPQKIN
jgi:hypothetical protein